MIREGIILNQDYFWGEKTVPNWTGKNLSKNEKSENKVTGKFSESEPKTFIDELVSSLKKFVSPLIETIKLSIK